VELILRYIQEILGCKSSKTAEIYTHVSKTNIASIKSLLDNILEEGRIMITPRGKYIYNADMNELSTILPGTNYYKIKP